MNAFINTYFFCLAIAFILAPLAYLVRHCLRRSVRFTARIVRAAVADHRENRGRRT